MLGGDSALTLRKPSVKRVATDVWQRPCGGRCGDPGGWSHWFCRLGIV